MKGDIGWLCIAAACALVGLVTRPEEPRVQTLGGGGGDEVAEAISSGLLALALLIAVVCVVRIGVALIRADQSADRS